MIRWLLRKLFPEPPSIAEEQRRRKLWGEQLRSEMTPPADRILKVEYEDVPAVRDDRDADSFELWDILERDHPEYIKALHDDEWALAEVGPSFLGFVTTYKRLASLIPRGRIVYDFGCCYAAQAWYFRDHARYVGVTPHDSACLTLANGLYYVQTAQEHIAKYGPFGKDTFAIVNYVPDDGAADAVKAAFRDCYTFYPERSDHD